MLQKQLLDVTTLTPSPDPPLGFDARLAAVDAAMILRLEDASTAHTVDAAQPETHLNTADLTDGAQAYADAHRPAPTLYPTPTAALLQRAHTRLQRDGWCTDALSDEQGAHCLLGALRIEARGDHALADHASALLLEAIRRQFDVESVAQFNDACREPHTPLRLLGQAAVLADARGL